MQTSVTLKNIKYIYQKTNFLLEIEQFGFSAGRCVALRGHNGSGKTTLGKIVAGLIRPSVGEVLIEGEDISKWSLGKIGSRVGYLFQDPSRQIFAPIVREEITFPLVLRGMRQEEADARADALLEQFEMTHLRESITYTLSHGEKQRLAICAMLVNRPRFLVLDEPTTALDARRRGILGAVLKRLTGEGIGILLISHSDEFIKAQSAEVFIIERGRLRNG